MDPPTVTDAHTESTAPSYEIESLLGKRVAGDKPHYLVKWRGYGYQHNVWNSIDNLKDAAELIADYEATAPRLSRRPARATGTVIPRRTLIRAPRSATRQSEVEIQTPKTSGGYPRANLVGDQPLTPQKQSASEISPF